MEITEIIKKLKYFQAKIQTAGLITNITGGALESAALQITQRFSRFGPPKPRLDSNHLETSFDLSIDKRPKAEVFASASLQVGFAALTLNAAPFDTMEQVAETVLTHQLSTGTLWEEIRILVCCTRRHD